MQRPSLVRLRPPKVWDLRFEQIDALICSCLALSLIAAGAAVWNAWEHDSVRMACWQVGALALAVLAGWVRGNLSGFLGGADHAWDLAREELRQSGTPTQGVPSAPAAWPAPREPLIPGQGYLYVLAFSTGAVKVGQTVDPARRIGEHRRDAAAFGVAIVAGWVSPAHLNYTDNEIALIRGCAKLTTGRAKREYFPGLAFDSAVRVAAELHYFSDRPVPAQRKAGQHA